MGKLTWLIGVIAIIPFAVLRAYLWLARKRNKE